ASVEHRTRAITSQPVSQARATCCAPRSSTCTSRQHSRLRFPRLVTDPHLSRYPSACENYRLALPRETTERTDGLREQEGTQERNAATPHADAGEHPTAHSTSKQIHQ